MEHGLEPRLIEYKGKVLGIDLSANYVSEHECGIRAIQQAFGLPIADRTCTLTGFEARKVTKFPEGVWYGTTSQNGMALVYHSFLAQEEYAGEKNGKSFGKPPSPETQRTRVEEAFLRTLDLRGYDPQQRKEIRKPLATAWDQNHFGIHAPIENTSSTSALDALHSALQRYDLVITTKDPELLENAGLCMLVYSLLPQELHEKMRKTDEKRLAK